MTTDISDAARELADKLNIHWPSAFCTREEYDRDMAAVQTALNAARNSGLEDAANAAATLAERPFDSEPEFSTCLAVENVIRRMKVKP